ncbi:RNA exonuclease ngl2 [Marasmius tenuissimus]|uniref:RNA exonuclease ngl2 n=1 Tax=Marasmius tenuissimus TaxID=585030 RepID=A0ABR3ADS1_9AGAR
MASKRVLTPEQLVLQEARRLKKAKVAATQVQSEPQLWGNAKTLERKWHQLAEPSGTNVTQRVKILTWNLLAQCLVRRELFPNSDCLKAGQRENMIYREILTCEADILCLQEVDRLEKLLPILERAGYTHHYASGPRKLHGCLIAYKQELYELAGQRTIYYDEQEVRTNGEESRGRGSSFRTKNIGHIASLRNKKNDQGVIIATTHLFWHPKYVYERARQAGILKRETLRYRDETHPDWPCILAGDFNFTPDDAAYSFAVGDPLSAPQKELLDVSRVVHTTIDPSFSDGGAQKEDENEETAAPDPDRVIVNARPAQPSDGLLSSQELEELFTKAGPPLRSMYDLGLRLHKETRSPPSGDGAKFVTFGERTGLQPHRRGYHEPQWTSYTYYWQNSIDYIFVVDPVDVQSTVVGLLSPPSTSDLEPGIPRQGVSGSDHVSLCVEIAFTGNSVI